MKKLIIIILLSGIVVSCTPSVGKRIISKNNLETTLTIGGSFFKYLPFYAPLPNVGIGLKYGILDNINIGVNLHPLMLYFNSLLIEPYTAFSIYKSDNIFIPSVNGYISINSLAYFNLIGVNFYPLIGEVNIWKINNVLIYVPFEVSFDFYSDIRKVKFNMGIGTEIPILEKVYLSAEFRINSVGNIYLPLNTMVGVPNLFVSVSYLFN
ncbi:MAG: hypothetical protein ACP5PT_05175 [Brevinematia bacterium]